MTGPERRRSGSGKKTPPAAGKGGSAGVVQPGAAASVLEGAPGQIVLAGEAILINAGREIAPLTVVNTADRPISVASHFHFAEANAALDFDRATAWGKRLNILAGSMLRFDPGASQEVELVPLAGRRVVRGLRGECGGSLDD